MNSTQLREADLAADKLTFMFDEGEFLFELSVRSDHPHHEFQLHFNDQFQTGGSSCDVVECRQPLVN